MEEVVNATRLLITEAGGRNGGNGGGGDDLVLEAHVESFCQNFPRISLVVTIPLAFVLATIIVGNVLLIFHSCRSQQPNSRPIQLPTVCFASGNLLNTGILLVIQFYFISSETYSCNMVHIIRHFQLVVLTFFCAHVFVAAVRFGIVMFRPSFQLSDSVLSPHVRTALVIIWFQDISHCFSVLINLFIMKRTPAALSIGSFCLLLSVPILSVLLFVMSQAIRHYRWIRRNREWSGETISYWHSHKQCIVFKWSLVTACTVLIFWLPFWTKNVHDYLADPESLLQAFDVYSWVVIDILLLSNSFVIHLV